MHTIRLNSNGKLFDGLDIENVSDGLRDRKCFPNELRDQAMGVLTAPGGVTFRTKSGKKWHLKFDEFSFHIPAKA